MPIQIPDILRPRPQITDGVPLPWIVKAEAALRLLPPRARELMRESVYIQAKEAWENAQKYSEFPRVEPQKLVPQQMGLVPDPGLLEKMWGRIPDPAQQGLTGLSGLLDIPFRTFGGLATIGGRNLADMLRGRFSEAERRGRELRERGLLSGGYRAFEEESVPFGTGLAGFLAPFPGGIGKRAKVVKESGDVGSQLIRNLFKNPPIGEEPTQVPKFLEDFFQIQALKKTPYVKGKVPYEELLRGLRGTVKEHGAVKKGISYESVLRGLYGPEVLEANARKFAENLPDAIKAHALDTLERAKIGLTEGRISQESYNRLLKGLPGRWNKEAARLAESPISEPLVRGFETPPAPTLAKPSRRPHIPVDDLKSTPQSPDSHINRDAVKFATRTAVAIKTGFGDVGAALTIGLAGLANRPHLIPRVAMYSLLNIVDNNILKKFTPSAIHPFLDRYNYATWLANKKSLIEWAKQTKPDLELPGVAPELAAPELLEKIPVVGIPFRIGRRNMQVLSDVLRWEIIDAATQGGKNLAGWSSKDLDKLLDTATALGGAHIGPLGQSRFMQYLAFAPRLYDSIWTLLERSVTNWQRHPGMTPQDFLFSGPGGEARRSLATLFGTAFAFVTLWEKAQGRTPPSDPADPNWMTAQDIGGADYRLLGPFHNFVRGVMLAASGEKLKGAELIARSKMSPLVSWAFAIYTGYTPYGKAVGGIRGEMWDTREEQERNIKNILVELAPMYISNMFDPAQEGVNKLVPIATFGGMSFVPRSFTERREEWLTQSREKILGTNPPPNMLKTADSVTDAKSWAELTPQDQMFLMRTPELQEIQKRFESDRERDLAAGKLTPSISENYYLTRKSNYKKKLDISQQVEEGKIDLKEARKQFREINTETGERFKSMEGTPDYKKRVQEMKARSKIPPEYDEALSKYHGFGKDYDARDEWLANQPDKVQTYVESNVGTTLVPLEKRVSSMYKIVKPYEDISEKIISGPQTIAHDEFFDQFPTRKYWEDMKKRYDSYPDGSRERQDIRDEEVEIEVDGKLKKIKPYYEYLEAVGLQKLRFRAQNPEVEQALLTLGRVPKSVKEEMTEARNNLIFLLKQKADGEEVTDAKIKSALNDAKKWAWVLELWPSPFPPKPQKTEKKKEKSDIPRINIGRAPRTPTVEAYRTAPSPKVEAYNR